MFWSRHTKVEAVIGGLLLFVQSGFCQAPQLWGIADSPGGQYSTLFKVNGDGTGYQLVYTTNGTDGGAPSGSLIEASDGILYGMCESGGANNLGTIFSYDPGTSSFNKLFDFNGSSGANPFGSLLQVSCDELYGMTQAGGTYGKGVIFSININTHSYTKHLDFISAKGIFPAGNLIKATNGLLYGLTNGGGTNNSGTLFSFDPSGSSFAKLFDFGGQNGQAPFGSLMQATNGKLYGMTYYGGSSNSGVVFRFDISSNSYSKLVDLNFSRGINPVSNLVQAPDGRLLGMTPNGGANICGVLFSINPSDNSYTKLLDMGVTNAQPNGALMNANDGYLYGTAETGTAGTNGSVFRFDPVTSGLTTIYTFTNGSGAGSPACDLVEYIPVSEEIEVQAPNIVTSNNDGINDNWFPIITGPGYSFSECNVHIYDRWGKVIFDSSGKTIAWNGKTNNGFMCPEGTYFYILSWKAVSLNCKEKTGVLNGFIQLMR